MKSCFFIGHRQTPGEVFSFLYEAIEKHITYMRHSASNTCELVRYAHLREEKGLLRVTRL